MKSRKLRKELTWILIVLEIVLITISLLILSVNLSISTSVGQEFAYFLIANCTLILCLINYFIIKRFGNKKVINLVIDNGCYEEKLR